MKCIRTNETKLSLSVALAAALCGAALGGACAPPPDEATSAPAAVSELRAITGGEPVIIDEPAPAKTWPLPGDLLPVNPPIDVAPPPPPPAHQVCGRLARVTSNQLDGALTTLLSDTKIVYDTTKTSTPLVGQVYVCSYPNHLAHEAAVAECYELPKTAWTECFQEANETFPDTPVCGTSPANFYSYIDFGSYAESKGAEDELFESETIWKDTSTGWASFDISYVHTAVTTGNLTSSFTSDAATGRPTASLSLKLYSNNPTIPCTYWLGCPDIELYDMRVDARLIGIAPTADRTQLGFDQPDVTFSFTKNLHLFPDWLVAIFFDVEGLIRGRVERTLEKALKKDQTHAAVNKALTGLVKAYAPSPVQSFYSAWFENGDLVVDYQPVSDILGSAVNNCLSANVAP